MEKKKFLKNVGCQIVSPIDFQNLDTKFYGSQCDLKLFGILNRRLKSELFDYQHSSKYLQQKKEIHTGLNNNIDIVIHT